VHPRSAALQRQPTTDDIRELVRSECLGASNRFGPAFFGQHLLPVVEYGRQLAQRLGADEQVVELAGWLHDISAVRDLACVPTHHLDSARISRDLLRERGWPPDIVDAVCRCIASHSAPVAPGDGSVEEVCVSNADVMAQLARPAYWFFYLHRVRGFDHDEGLAWWRTRLERGWSGLVEDAQAVVAAEHGAVVRFVAAAAQAS